MKDDSLKQRALPPGESVLALIVLGWRVQVGQHCREGLGGSLWREGDPAGWKFSLRSGTWQLTALSVGPPGCWQWFGPVERRDSGRGPSGARWQRSHGLFQPAGLGPPATSSPGHHQVMPEAQARPSGAQNGLEPGKEAKRV